MPNELPGATSSLITLSLGTAMLSFLGISGLPAQQPFHWNPSGTGIPSGGTGIWDSTSTRWTWNNGGIHEAFPANEENGSNYGIAWFSGNAGTVTTSGAISAGGIHFDVDGYTLNAGAGSSLRLVTEASGFLPSITVAGAGNSATINSPVSGGDGFIVRGKGTLNLTGANPLTGNIGIVGGNLRLLAAGGSLHSSNILQFYDRMTGASGGGTFILDNVGATGAKSQTFAGLEAWGGDNIIISRRTAGQNLTLTFNNYSNGWFGSRLPGATFNFVSEGGVNGTSNRIILNATDSGFVDAGSFFGGADYAWKNSSGGWLRAINYGVDAGTAISNGGASIASTNHVRINGNITAQTTASFLTMKIDGSHDFAIGSGEIVTVDGLLKAGASGSTISGGNIRSSGQELIIRTYTAADSLAINSVIEDNGGAGTALVKSGDGTLYLNGTNTFTGYDNGWDPRIGVFLNAGTISVSSLPTGSEASTLGTGSLVFSGGTLRYTGTDSVTTTRGMRLMASGGTFDISEAGAVVTLDSNVAAATSQPENSLIKTGAGTLSLAGVESNGVSVVVNGGTLLLAKTPDASVANAVYKLTINSGATVRLEGSGGNQIDDSSSVTVNTGAIFDLNGREEIINELRGNGSVTNQSSTGNGILSIGPGSHDADFSGIISNGSAGRTLALEKLYSGTQILSGNNTYTGGTTVRDGILQIGNGGTTGSISGNVVVEYLWHPYTPTDGAIAFNRSDALSFGGSISGSGRIIQNGPGTLTLSGSNSYTGSTLISGGILSVASLSNGDSNSGIGASSSDAANLVLDGGTLRYTGAARSTDRLFTVTAKGGSLDASGTGALSFTSTDSIVMGGSGSRALTLTGTGTGSLASVIGNPTGSTTSLIKEGAGTWTLSGTNTFTGGVTIKAGTLTASTNANFGGAGGTIGLAGGTLNLANNTGSTFNRSVTVSADSTVNSNRVTNGAGVTHTLGALSIGSQTLSIARGTGATSGTGGIIFGATTLTGNSTFSPGSNAALTLGALTDGGTARTITKTGAGALTLATSATSLVTSTAVNLQAGNINLNHANALGALSNVTISSGATLAVGTSVNATFGALNGTGSITLGGNTLTIGTSNNLTSSFGGTISGTNGKLVKNGAGTLTLTSAHTYTGGTTISGGRVRANNSTGSAFGTGAVTVQLNTTLSGIGAFTGAATVHGTYAPGNSVGNLTSGSITVGSTGAYEWEINNATGTAGNTSGGWDLATINGTLVFQSGATLSLKSLGLDNLSGLATNFDGSASYSWKIAGTTGGITGLGNVTIDDSGFQNDHTGSFSLSVSGNDLLLRYTAVPEPAAVFLASLSATAFLLRRRTDQPSNRNVSSL